MNTSLDHKLANTYTSTSQKMRILTEHWVLNEIFCPNCGASVHDYENSRPVADFYCSSCSEDYELKSKQNTIGRKIVDGAYSTMIERLQSDKNPNFFFLTYTKSDWSVSNFAVIPKHFFVPDIIEKRKPLSVHARRAGWTGCNILLQSIPQTGKIYYVRDGQIEPKERVLSEWQKTLFLREEKEVSAKGWLLDVMRCVEKIGKPEFSLDDVYAFKRELSRLHPENNHIEDKIRQQLQVLRDKGYIDFVSRGRYRLV
jgi:type II restriction enzyme